jgi:adenylate kinase
MKHFNKQVIILFGPPGAGKGSQAILLADKLDIFHFETSAIIEKLTMNANEEDFIEEQGEKYYFKKEKQLWKEGKLCDPPFVVHIVKEKIRLLAGEEKGIVFSGSPRTVYEAKEVIPLLKELYGNENIKPLLIEISPKETIFRNSHRRICQLIRHPILYNKETVKLTICPLDGSKLIKRKGLDEPETIKVRLKEYKERTYPVLEIFKEQGIEVRKINGEQSVADVHKDILKTIK